MTPLDLPRETDAEQCQRAKVSLAFMEDLRQHFDAPKANIQRIVSLTYTYHYYGATHDTHSVQLKCLRKLSKNQGQIIHAAITHDKFTIAFRIRQLDSHHELLEALRRL